MISKDCITLHVSLKAVNVVGAINHSLMAL